MKTRTYNNLLIFILIIIAIPAWFFFVGNMKLNEYYRLEAEREENIKTSLSNLPILAKAVSVYNITKNKKIYSKNDEVPLPVASLAKILIITQSIKNQRPDDMIYVSPEAISQAGDFGMFAHEKWTALDLAKLTLIVSANDGAFALSQSYDRGNENFISDLNLKAKKIGAENTLFLNPTGLDLDLENAGAFASASDINIMAMYALKVQPEIFSATTLPEINLTSVSGFEHNFKNTNTLIGKIPNLLLSKTGYTEVAQGNLVIIFKNQKGEDIAVTVLGSTFEGRFADMEKIVNILNVY